MGDRTRRVSPPHLLEIYLSTQTMKTMRGSFLLLLGASLALAAPTLQEEGVASPDDVVPESQHMLPSAEWSHDGALSAEQLLQTPHDEAFEAMSADQAQELLQGATQMEEPVQVKHTTEVLGTPATCPVVCKTPKDYGGGTCIHRTISSWATMGIRGHYCKCKKGFAGGPCDLGPSKCGEAACFDKGLKVTADKSLLLSAIHLSALAYYPGKTPKEVTEREAYCPGIDKRMNLSYKHYKTKAVAPDNSDQGKDTRLEWGVAHGSYGQRDGKKLYAVAFRGTVSLTNWITNIKAIASRPDFLKKGYVHWGFLAALKPHINEVVAEILKAADGHHQLLVTGHSLGGALANIFALIVKRKFVEAGSDVKVQLITLGAPRVGTIEFQQELEKSMDFIHRIVGKCDIVPKHPRHIVTTSLLNGLPFADSRMAAMVHAGPQITVGCDTWFCTHHHYSDHLTSTYLKRMQTQIKGDDHSICPNAKA